MIEIARRLKEFRESHANWSQTKLASMLGLQQRTYANYETGRNEPPQKVLMQLAALGCDLNWLLTGNESLKAKGLRIASQVGSSRIDFERLRSERAELELLKCGIPIPPTPPGEDTESPKVTLSGPPVPDIRDELLKLRGQVEILERLLEKKDKEIAEIREHLRRSQSPGSHASDPSPARTSPPHT